MAFSDPESVPYLTNLGLAFSHTRRFQLVLRRLRSIVLFYDVIKLTLIKQHLIGSIVQLVLDVRYTVVAPH